MHVFQKIEVSINVIKKIIFFLLKAIYIIETIINIYSLFT